MPAVLPSPSGPPIWLNRPQVRGHNRLQQKRFFGHGPVSPSYGVHRDRKFRSSKLVVVWMSGNHPTQKSHTRARKWKRLRPGRILFTPHRKHPSNTKFNRLMVLRQIKTSDNNAKPYIICSKIQKCFAEAQYIALCFEKGRYTGVLANT